MQFVPTRYWHTRHPRWYPGKIGVQRLCGAEKAKKITALIPTQLGSSLITVLPEQLQSPLLTAEWEQRLGEVERGNLDPADFMDGIAALVCELVRDYQPVPGAEVLFPSERETVGICPRCGRAVTESKKLYSQKQKIVVK